MPSHPRRRQVGFFLVAVIVPSTVLVALGVQLVRQERQIAAQRTADERDRIVDRARESFYVELGRVQRTALDAAGRDSLGFSSRRYSGGPVALAARIDGVELRLPWDQDPRTRQAARSLSAANYARQVSAGKRAEFADGDLARATREYEAAVTAARDTIQRATAGLLLARALAKSGKSADALSRNRRLLELPSSITDETGIPIALYAADRLAHDTCCHAQWIERVSASVSEARWHLPAEAYLLRDLLDRTSPTADSMASAHLADLRSRIAAEIAVIEKAMRLRDALPRLGLRSSGFADTSYGSRWVRFSDDWLIGAAPMNGGEWGLVALALDRVPDLLSASESWPGAARLTLENSGATVGEPVDPALAGLAILTADAIVSSGGAAGLRRGFYVGALLFVLGVTLFGAYVVWLDVRRELRIAELRAHFVSSVSHELRTPLTAIRMFAERLRVKPNADTAMQVQYLDTIVGESERLTRLVNNVLDLSKIEQEQKRYRKDPVAIADVVYRCVQALEYPLARGGFTLNVAVESPLLTVRGDADALEQALLNLLSNAMKYSGDSRDIDVRLSGQNGDAVIEVVDRGVGIPAGAVDRLTETFFRVETDENERIPGAGLGLALVRHALDAHGGRLVVSSTEGEGSTFAIHLPLEAQ